MTEDKGLEGYQGDLARHCVTIAEVLREALIADPSGLNLQLREPMLTAALYLFLRHNSTARAASVQ